MRRILFGCLALILVLTPVVRAGVITTDGNEIACDQPVRARVMAGDPLYPVDPVAPLRRHFPLLCDGTGTEFPAGGLPDEVFANGFTGIMAADRRELDCEEAVELRIDAWIDGLWRPRTLKHRLKDIFPLHCANDHYDGFTAQGIETTAGDLVTCDDTIHVDLDVPVGDGWQIQSLHERAWRILPLLCGVTLSDGAVSNGEDPEADRSAPVELCSDGIDNDGDGQIDLADNDCTGPGGSTCSDSPSCIPILGFGRHVTGGQGKPIYTVTNLNDAGAGSLRDALSQGDRNIKFSVSGTIALQSTITLDGKSSITIDGFSAPGTGIVIDGISVAGPSDAIIITNSENIIIKGIRIQNAGNDGLQITSSSNLVITHNTFSGAGDGALDLTIGVTDVTISWNIIADTSVASLIKYSNSQTNPQRFTIHNNLYTGNGERNPLLDDVTDFDYFNNVIYDWSSYGVLITNGAAGNVIGNYFIPTSRPHAALWTSNTPGQFYLAGYRPQIDGSSTDPTPNMLPDENWDRAATEDWSGFMAQSAFDYGYPVTYVSAEQALMDVLSFVGPKNRTAQELSYIDEVISATTEPPPLVAHWTFDEGAGDTAADVSGNGHDGTLVSGADWTGGAIGSFAVALDGADDYVNVGIVDVSGSAMTLTGWFRVDDLGCVVSDCRILSKAAGTNVQDHFFMLSMVESDGAQRLRFRLKTNGNTDTLVGDDSIVNDGQWYHVAAVYDGTEMVLYQDAVVVGRTTKTGQLDLDSSVETWIGSNPPSATSRPWAGQIDEVRIFRRALSESEVIDLYNE